MCFALKRTTQAKAAKKAEAAAFWKKAYEAKLRAEHGWRLGFVEGKVPEELMVEKRTKYQKWHVLVYWPI